MTVDYMFVVWQQLPLHLAWLTGVILSLVLWRRHPRTSLLAGLGFAILLVNSVYGLYYSLFRMPRLLASSAGHAEFGRIVFLHGVATNVVGTIGAILLILAIFARRADPAVHAGAATPATPAGPAAPADNQAQSD